MSESTASGFPYQPALPMGSVGLRSSGFWGVLFLILSEVSMFAYLFFSYFYFSVQPHPGPWPPDGPPDVTWAVLQTAVALVGCGTMWWADHSTVRFERAGVLLGLAISLLLALAFIAFQVLDWRAKPFALATGPYSSLYFTIGGVHLAHAIAGAVMMAAVLLWSLLGYFGPVRHVPITVAAVYWYFVAVVWLGVLFTLYITPYLG